MSLELYATRLYWDGRVGSARHDGVTVQLRECPRLLPILRGMVQIDYAPEVRVAIVREHAQPSRDLTGVEVAAIETWLQRMAAAARNATTTSE